MECSRFKFRVWDNINKRYEKDLSLIDKDGSLCYQDGGKYCNGEHSEDFTIEQCTGLTDKNGKLIYEGDAALFDNGTYEIKGATICFTGSGFCAKWDGGHTTPLHAINDIIEIIGNIHEMESEND